MVIKLKASVCLEISRKKLYIYIYRERERERERERQMTIYVRGGKHILARKSDLV
jgi:hypothetical protein